MKGSLFADKFRLLWINFLDLDATFLYNFFLRLVYVKFNTQYFKCGIILKLFMI